MNFDYIFFVVYLRRLWGAAMPVARWVVWLVRIDVTPLNACDVHTQQIG